jgi:hypothetical protein
MIGPSRRTFKDLVDEVLEWAGMGDDTNRLRALAKRAVKAAHQRRLVSGRWTFMLFPKPQTLSIVAGQQNYSLHDSFNTPLYFRSLSATNARRIRPVPYARLADYLPEAAASGDTVYVSLAGVSKVQNQPTSASVITPTSTAPADSGKQVVVVGDTATGVQTETLTLPSAGSVQFTTILDVTKLGTGWAGTLSLTSNGGAVTILQLAAAQYGRQFPQLRLLLPPQGNETWEYQHFRLGKQLELDTDIPDIPYPFDQLLVLDAKLSLQDITRPTASAVRQWEKEAFELEQDMSATFQDGLAQDSETHYVEEITRY